MEGIHSFETYGTVVHWKTVRLMLIIEFLLVFKYKQGGVASAFLHADIPEDDNVYVEMPIGFEQFSKNGRKKFLKLKKTLYGIFQIPRTLWQYTTKNLDQIGLNQ